MTLDNFAYCMNEFKKEYDWREQCEALSFNVMDNSQSFYLAIDLLSELMQDKSELLPYFIFEGRFGTIPVELDDGTFITTIEELYNVLTKDGDN